MNPLPNEVVKLIHIEDYDRFIKSYDNEFREFSFEDGATWALQSPEVMAIINAEKDKEIAELKASIAGYKAFLKPLEDTYNEETKPI